VIPDPRQCFTSKSAGTSSQCQKVPSAKRPQSPSAHQPSTLCPGNPISRRGSGEGLEFLAPIIGQLTTTIQGTVSATQAATATINDLAPKLKAISQRIEMLTESSNNIYARTRRTEDQLRKLEEHFDRLRLLVKSFDERLGEQFKLFDKRFDERMAISEPWLPEEHFLHSEPEYYLAAFLYSFLPNRTLVDVGANEVTLPKSSRFRFTRFMLLSLFRRLLSG